MQNKGLVRFFAIAFALVCLYQLSFTFFSRKVERNARKYAQSERFVNEARTIAGGNELLFPVILDSLQRTQEQFYLDSMKSRVVYNIGVRKYTYREVKERELNLGLDLRGGMNVTLEISVPEIVRAMAGYTSDQSFNAAMERAIAMQRTSRDDFITLFGRAFEEVDPGASLAYFFSTPETRDRISITATNDEVLRVLRREVNDAVDRSFQILRTRIDRFGVAQPNIQKLATSGRILVELPGIKEPERVRRLLQGTARLEFWETYEFSDLYNYFWDANERLKDMQAGRSTQQETTQEPSADAADLTETDEITAEAAAQAVEDTPSLLDLVSGELDQASSEDFENFAQQNPLFAFLTPAFVQDETGNMFPGRGPVVGYAAVQDTARVMSMLRNPQISSLFPRNMRLFWNVKPARGTTDLHELVAIRESTRDGRAPLTGEVITDARQDYSNTGQVEITMAMNAEGARTWRRMTADNIGRSIAIVLDDFVYSFPTVQNEISGGRSQITGQFTIQEAQDMANILKAGSLPAPARIVEEAIVGPSLGREAISSGLISFVIAFIIVLIYMAVYYSRAGFVADLALVANIFFIFGVLASLGAVLTLPGIAGIVLTLGMAVDANVIIYERIKEEVRAGKGMRLAISDGYKNAYSAIIDGNVTTLLTGIVLYTFGTGPVQGFATTLIIGILSSMFSAILISRIIFDYYLRKNKAIAFGNNLTNNALATVNIDFLGMRKKAYILSTVVIIIGLGSLALRGVNYGVDFSGGRTYVVRFDNPVNTNEVRAALVEPFEQQPEVKTFGPSSQVKITTKYRIDDDSPAVDSTIQRKLYDNLKVFYNDQSITYKDFTAETDAEKLIGILSSQKVGPTIASDIRNRAVMSIVIALLVIFAYIAIRFKRWQFGLSGVIALFHDSLITISLFSIFYNVLPFNLEIDQAFIAAILTIIGYSINDTVIVFDRIREYLFLHPKKHLKTNINDGLNSTLARTLNTSGTTLLVLLMIFIFGGEVIRGFTFALFMGILVGTYSSLFVASPLAYDMLMSKKKKQS
ncbi:MAG: protein translocase subunit SecDF [Sphingobacteriia bacterium]|nr:protein translocase subunit SecDF [Sphingobacteriia bacterium]